MGSLRDQRDVRKTRLGEVKGLCLKVREQRERGACLDLVGLALTTENRGSLKKKIQPAKLEKPDEERQMCHCFGFSHASTVPCSKRTLGV